MQNILERRILTLSITLFIALWTLARTTLGFEGENAASVGIYIKDLKTGKVLAECDPQRALVPASVMKSVTAASALCLLGEDYAFHTPVYLYGNRDDADSSKWNGNMVIHTCGDPTIDSELFKNAVPFWREIISGLKRIGINTITGKIIIDETMLQPGCVPQWEIEDVAWDYGAGLYGFNFRDNKFVLYPATGETRPYIPNLDVTVLYDADGTDMERGVFSDHLLVWGKDPENPKWRVNTTMNNPARVFIAMLKDCMEQEGLSLLEQDNEDVYTRQLVCEHVSPDAYDILSNMMSESHNLYAEAMLRALAPGSDRGNAIKTEKNFLTNLGLGIKYNKIEDGSGLSRTDRLQPIFLSNLYEKMAKGKYGKKYASLFPVVGVNGTVKNLLAKTRLKGKLALKSGSMGGVQCFAGYKLDSDGNPTHTVVILVNAFFCPRGEVRAAIEKLLLDTF